MNARLQRRSSGKIRAFCTLFIPQPRGLPCLYSSALRLAENATSPRNPGNGFPGTQLLPRLHSRSNRLTPDFVTSAIRGGREREKRGRGMGWQSVEELVNIRTVIFYHIDAAMSPIRSYVPPTAKTTLSMHNALSINRNLLFFGRRELAPID